PHSRLPFARETKRHAVASRARPVIALEGWGFVAKAQPQASLGGGQRQPHNGEEHRRLAPRGLTQLSLTYGRSMFAGAASGTPLGFLHGASPSIARAVARRRSFALHRAGGPQAGRALQWRPLGAHADSGNLAPHKAPLTPLDEGAHALG